MYDSFIFVSPSGGQKVCQLNGVDLLLSDSRFVKARITLARAVYSSAEILLLDDVSARFNIVP